jgi:hypothetical protein
MLVAARKRRRHVPTARRASKRVMTTRPAISAVRTPRFQLHAVVDYSTFFWFIPEKGDAHILCDSLKIFIV